MSVSRMSGRYGVHVYGASENPVTVEAVERWGDDSDMTNPYGGYLEFGDKIQYVEAGVLDCFPTLRMVGIGKDVKNIAVTDKTLKLFKENGVIVSGFFGGYAEEFARQYGLSFLHNDFRIGGGGDYTSPAGSDVITLILHKIGNPYIMQSNFCQGSSAGNSGGGDIEVTLRRDFWRNMTQKDIADLCWGNCRDAIMKNQDLASFLKGAKKNGGYFVKFKN